MPYIKKPEWIKTRLNSNKNFLSTKKILGDNRLKTVCEEALCPNKRECWNKKTATFMILGDVCTRSCGFCAVKTGKPSVYDISEPLRVAKAVSEMGLLYVVLTSVDRDELPDGGAEIWAQTIENVRRYNPKCHIETLIPDFKGSLPALNLVLQARSDILAHNLETVPALYNLVMPQASYEHSLWVLSTAKKRKMITKTGIMAGLGETRNQVIEVMKDAVNVGVDIFTIGQYLQPTSHHLPVKRYVHPKEFEEYKKIAVSLGMKYVESGPLVRSSYNAKNGFEIVMSDKV